MAGMKARAWTAKEMLVDCDLVAAMVVKARTKVDLAEYGLAVVMMAKAQTAEYDLLGVMKVTAMTAEQMKATVQSERENAAARKELKG